MTAEQNKAIVTRFMTELSKGNLGGTTEGCGNRERAV